MKQCSRVIWVDSVTSELKAIKVTKYDDHNVITDHHVLKIISFATHLCIPLLLASHTHSHVAFSWYIKVRL
jgi:hypothetical protein